MENYPFFNMFLKMSFQPKNRITIVFAVLILSASNSIFSQNLVPNASFENYIDFNSKMSADWHKVQKTDSPDYFNLNSSSPFNNIFDKYMGGTPAKSGTGFIGLFFYRLNPQRNIRNVREYIQTGLLEPLDKDSLYRVEFSLCLDAESNTAIKNLGICFNGEPLIDYSENRLFALTPQIEFSLTSPDCRNKWITFSTFYKAKGDERNLVLGNFKNDRNTATQRLIPIKDKSHREKWDLVSGEKAAYYYIDDIVVEKITLERQINKGTLQKVVETDGIVTIDFDKIPLDSSIILKNIFFDFDRSDLLPASFNELQKLYNLLTENPTMRIKIEGHTDNFGGYDFNLQLSRKRAEAVVLYLIERGVSADRTESAGFSYAVPVATNETPEGRQLNRRVAFKIISK